MKAMMMLGAALGLAAAVSVSGPAHAQGKAIWDKISESCTLTCGAMAAVPMNSWKVMFSGLMAAPFASANSMSE